MSKPLDLVVQNTWKIFIWKENWTITAALDQCIFFSHAFSKDLFLLKLFLAEVPEKPKDSALALNQRPGRVSNKNWKCVSKACGLPLTKLTH